MNFKTNNQSMLAILSNNEMNQLNQMVIAEKLSVSNTTDKHQFCAADLWNIQKMRKVRSIRKSWS